MKKIKITCKGQKYLPVDELQAFQGDLKIITDENLEKLKRSIIKHGFSFPVFVWGDKIIDGHQRVLAVNDLLNDGFSIDNIPVVEIIAKDEKEAAEKLLFINSHYGEITEEGLLEYLFRFDLDADQFGDDLKLDGVDWDEIFEIEQDAILSDIVKSKKESRNLGEVKTQIKPVLYTDNIKIFEEAILSTGEINYGEALIEICRSYLENDKKHKSISRNKA